MNLFQTTDHHLKDEEPFFLAGKALDAWLLEFFKNQTEPFIYIDSGDRFHVSKETGRVNGEVVKFFLVLSELSNCKEIWCIQGNHDYKVDTGSALSTLEDLSPKINIVYEPVIQQLPEQKGYSLFLPHMKIKHLPYYNGRETYGKEEFYQEYFKDWEKYKDSLEFVSAHLGDESCGDLLQDADLSLFKCTKSNGHIHKTVSKSQLESATITRRDEIDKKCIMRKFDTKDFSKFEEIELPIVLNFAKIEYGTSLDEYFKNPVHKMPKTSLIVDIYGHDNEDVVREEYGKLFENTSCPKCYLGEVAAEERLLNVDEDLEREDLDVDEADLVELFEKFCDEKGVVESVKQDILKRLKV